ncbi:MAG: DUF4230 domain-containing protein [Elusimicrobia bacterium]|nr:DUF4230 domain-containing protein [Elusimicrobiota bacterium]
MRTVLIILVVALALAVGFMFARIRRHWAIDNMSHTSAHTIVKEIMPASEFVSLIYRYTTLISHRDSLRFGDMGIPFTENRFLYSFDGVIRFGFDGSLINVTENDNIITIQLPPIRVKSHTIKEDSLQVFDQTNNIFNPIRLDTPFRLNAERKIEMEMNARTRGIFDQARQEAKRQLTELLQAFPAINNYTIEFI